jgi:hypothetical protein
MAENTGGPTMWWARQDSNLQPAVMSGRTISFVEFAAFLFEFDRVRCGLASLFLVRNWCGAPEA